MSVKRRFGGREYGLGGRKDTEQSNQEMFPLRCSIRPAMSGEQGKGSSRKKEKGRENRGAGERGKRRPEKKENANWNLKDHAGPRKHTYE